MSENQSPEGNLMAEFRELGKNLTEVLRSAWDQPERKRLQQEVVNGLSELGNTLKEETARFSESPTGQRLKTDVGNITQRVQSGEVETRVRQELLNALQTANQRIQEAIGSLDERQAPEMRADRSAGSQSGEGQAAAEGRTSGQQESRQPSQKESPVWTEDKGDDQSSMDPASERRQEVHPDDVEAPSSDTGHREIHPDDVEA